MESKIRCSADAKPHTRRLPSVQPQSRRAARPALHRLKMAGWLKRQWIQEMSSAQIIASHNQLYTTPTTSSTESMRLSASWQAHKSRAPTSMAR
jgi:hypothetical protein